MTRGRFISLEGGEGTGKSTQIGRLAEFLRPRVGEPVRTREPGGSPGAESIRNLLVNGPAEKWSAQTETLLMYAARRDHIERVIEPALSMGTWVVCDRFADSTRAYQGVAGGADPALIRALEDHVLAGLAPDLTLVLDLPVDVGLARATARGEAEGRFEAKGTAFHEALRQAFLDIAVREPERCVIIDAQGAPGKALILAAEGALDIDKVAHEILRVLPERDESVLLTLAEGFRGGEGARRFELLFERLADQVHDMAHRGAMAGETAGLDRWAQVWDQLVRTPREAEGLNLDRADAFWTMMAQLTEAARA